MDTFQFFVSRGGTSVPETELPQRRHGYRGVKGDEALIAEIVARLGNRPHRIEPIVEIAAQVLAEWHADGWLPDPLDPICGALGESRIG